MSHRSPRPDATSRTTIDVAIGVLVGLRGCAPEQAFDELARVVHRTGIGIGAIAAALVDLAVGVSGSSAPHVEAFNAWGQLLATARLAPCDRLNVLAP